MGEEERRELDDAEELEYEVFISHRSNDRDRAAARILADKLEAEGIRCFLDMKDIYGGDSFIRPILTSVRRSRLVIVLFGDEMSGWVHFEASVAFFDEKLLPVSVNGAEVPNPYRRIQHEVVAAPDADTVDEAALERVAAEARWRLRGSARYAARTRRFRALNRLFFSGLPILFLVVIPFLLFPFSARTGSVIEAPVMDPAVWRDHANHLHVTLGAAILGGQFFIALGFARSVASPSYREREYGFETTERLFFIWAVLSVLQPLLGLYLVFGPHCPGACGARMHGWLWLSLVLYLLGMLLTWIGYVAARSARDLDRRHRSPSRIAARDFLANVLFLSGFLVTIAVLNLMITFRGTAG